MNNVVILFDQCQQSDNWELDRILTEEPVFVSIETDLQATCVMTFDSDGWPAKVREYCWNVCTTHARWIDGLPKRVGNAW